MLHIKRNHAKLYEQKLTPYENNHLTHDRTLSYLGNPYIVKDHWA